METVPGQERPREVSLPFEQIKLTPGDTLQIQSLIEGQTERHIVRAVGFLKPKSVLVTSPSVEGRVLFIREGQTFQVRAFSGLNVYAFKAQVLKSNSSPFPYLHLSYPAEVKAMRIRRTVRAPVKLIVAIYDQDGRKQIGAGRLVDLSVGGGRLQAYEKIDMQDKRVQIAFKAKLEGMEEVVNAPAFVRSVSAGEDEQGKAVYLFGLEFRDLAQMDRLFIQNLVYQSLLKENV